MDFDKINIDLENKFNKPYKEFYHRRVIIWIDEEEEFQEEIKGLSLKDVKILEMSENNRFTVKKILTYDDTESDYLVYCPISFKEAEDNWIEDIFIYSEIYRADLVSVQIDNMNLRDRDFDIRNTIRKYKKFFNAKSRRDSLKNYSQDIDSRARLELAIMAVVAGSDIKPDLILREVLMAGLNNYDNKIYEKFLYFNIEDSFWKMIEQGTGYANEKRNLFDLFKHIIITASCRNINQKVFQGLENSISKYHQDFSFQFVENWIRDSQDRDIFYNFAKEVSDEIDLYNRLITEDLSDFDQNQFFPCLDEVVLTKILSNIKNDIIDPEEIYEVCEDRRVLAWYDEFKEYYKIIYYTAKIKEFYNNNQESFHVGSADEIWESYADKFYIMDTYYRKFHKNYQLSLDKPNSYLDDLVKYTIDRVEGIYENWFLNKFLSNWTNASSEDFENYGRLPGLVQQVNFYKNNIELLNARAFVIISDAMRYEVAVELYEDLEREMQCQVSIENMEGTFPTITSFGMASLLPNNGLEVEIKKDSMKVLIDGESTDMPYREKILRKANINSKVLKYDDFIHMKQSDRRLEAKGMEVVYIYHDKIDKTSHNSEADVFSACDKAIDEIKNLVRILVGDLSAINIFITSDHGFLYNYKEWEEHNKVENVVSENTLSYGRRYVVSDSSDEEEYLMPVKLITNGKEIRAFTPKDNVRIKKHGGGINYVHGGVSPQEKMVPLIKYKYLRNNSKEYQKNRSKYDVLPADLKLLSNSRKITNFVFNLSFYQSERLSSNRESANYIIYFEDERGNKISDEVKIIADKTSYMEEDRVFNVIFNLNPGNYDNRKIYYLKICEKDSKVEPKSFEFNIDIPFENNKLDFFN